MSNTEIKDRLTAIENQLADLTSARANGRRHPIEALDQLHGSFENDAAFKEATRLGRRWRESQRPKSPRAKAKRK